MKVDPWIAKGTMNRDWVELGIRVDKVKRELLRVFSIERDASMQRRKRDRKQEQEKW